METFFKHLDANIFKLNFLWCLAALCIIFNFQLLNYQVVQAMIVVIFNGFIALWGFYKNKTLNC